MENTNEILARNINKYRARCGITQEELASRLGVTYQAVSKWENAKAAPDISFLPDMAEIFGCHIDELFGRKVTTEKYYSTLPWDDDGTLRGVVFLGRKLLHVSDDGLKGDRFTFAVTSETGEIYKVYSEWNIFVSCNVSGGCEAGGNIAVAGSASGGCNAGGDIGVTGPCSGGCNAGGDLSVGGSVSGDVTCGNSMTVDGSIEAKTIRCDDNLKVEGKVEATNIYGNVTCNEVKCDKIEGDVTLANQ